MRRLFVNKSADSVRNFDIKRGINDTFIYDTMVVMTALISKFLIFVNRKFIAWTGIL